MAQRRCVIKGNQGISFQGLFRSFDKNFTLNGYDVFIEVIDGNGDGFSTVEFHTRLGKVHAAKIINVADGDGNALDSVNITIGAQGIVTADLDALDVSDVIIFVAVGSRV